MTNDNPLARAGRDSAGDKYDRHRAAARSLLEQKKAAVRPRLSLVVDGDNAPKLSRYNYRQLVHVSFNGSLAHPGVQLISEPQTRVSKRQIAGEAGIGLFTLTLTIGCGTGLIVSPDDRAIFGILLGLAAIALVLATVNIVVDALSPETPFRVVVPQGTFTDDDIDAPEANLVAHAVDALGQIEISETWQSDWLRAPREQIDLAREADHIARAGYRLTKLRRTIGDKPEGAGAAAEQWERLHDTYTHGLDDLRRRATEAVTLRIAVDDVADLITEADKRRIEASKLTEAESLAAQILADSPEHARAADRLAELTAATGSVHEVLALEIAADVDAIESAAGALSVRGEQP